MNNESTDFGMERRLKELDPGLHARFTDTVFSMQHALDLCRSVVNHRTPFTISQRNVEIEWI